MSTLLENYYISNAFDSPQWSRERKVVYALNQAGRLLALDGKFFATTIDTLRTQAQAFSLSIATTSSAVTQQAGDTLEVNAALQNVRDVVSGKYGVLKDKLGKNSPILASIFGKRFGYFTQELNIGNYAQRTGELLLNMQANADSVGTVVIEAVQVAVDAVVTARDNQGKKKGTVAVSRTTAETANDELTVTLFATAGQVMQRYPTRDDEAKRRAAFDFSLLPRPQGGTHATILAGFVAGTATELLLDELPNSPLLKVRFTNVGNVRLCFALSATGTVFPATGSREVLPGATLTCTLADLGTPPPSQPAGAQPHLGAGAVRGTGRLSCRCHRPASMPKAPRCCQQRGAFGVGAGRWGGGGGGGGRGPGRAPGFCPGLAPRPALPGGFWAGRPGSGRPGMIPCKGKTGLY